MMGALDNPRFNELLVHFAGQLRRAGVDAPPGSCVDIGRAVETKCLRSMRELRLGMRAVFTSRYEDIDVFDRVFSAFWYGEKSHGEPHTTEGGVTSEQFEGPLESGGQSRAKYASTGLLEDSERLENREAPLATSGFSANTRYWRGKASEVTNEDIANASKLALKLVQRLRTAQAARFQSSSRHQLIDWRRVIRSSMRNQGQAMRLFYRRRKPTRARLVVLCDVSGSMTAHTGLLLAVLFALGAVSQKSQLGVFATRLIMFEPEEHFHRNLASTIATACAGVGQWNTGTNIGACLKEFNYTRMLPKSCSFVILSDGWDNGDAETVRNELMQLRAKVRRLVWINPLQGSPGFRPETACLKAALPFVDDFLPGHSVGALIAACQIIMGSEKRPPAVPNRHHNLVQA